MEVVGLPHLRADVPRVKFQYKEEEKCICAGNKSGSLLVNLYRSASVPVLMLTESSRENRWSVLHPVVRERIVELSIRCEECAEAPSFGPRDISPVAKGVVLGRNVRGEDRVLFHLRRPVPFLPVLQRALLQRQVQQSRVDLNLDLPVHLESERVPLAYSICRF